MLLYYYNEVVIIIYTRKEVRHDDLLKIRLPAELKSKLNGVATERGEDLSVVVRRFCEDGLNRYYTEQNMDFIKSEFRETVKEASSSDTERLAKIGAKGTISSLTTMYMLVEFFGMQNVDVKDIYSSARTKAVESLRKKEGFE